MWVRSQRLSYIQFVHTALTFLVDSWQLFRVLGRRTHIGVETCVDDEICRRCRHDVSACLLCSLYGHALTELAGDYTNWLQLLLHLVGDLFRRDLSYGLLSVADITKTSMRLTDVDLGKRVLLHHRSRAIRRTGSLAGMSFRVEELERADDRLVQVLAVDGDNQRDGAITREGVLEAVVYFIFCAGLRFDITLGRLRRYLRVTVPVLSQRRAIDDDLDFEPGYLIDNSHGVEGLCVRIWA
jgi:hypothetical protein